MSVKYHINPETGRPNQCNAQTSESCKYAHDGQVPQHYESKEDARAGYEKSMQNDTFAATAVKKVSQKTATKNPKDVSPHHVNIKTVKEYPAFVGKSDAYKKTYEDVENFMERTINPYADGEEGIVVDEGKWDLPDAEYAESDPWHAGDRKYTENPSFTVQDKRKFFNSMMEKVPYDENTVNEKWTELKSNLDDAGFFDSDNYEAEIESGYYGEEFNGWTMDGETSLKVAHAMAKTFDTSTPVDKNGSKNFNFEGYKENPIYQKNYESVKQSIHSRYNNTINIDNSSSGKNGVAVNEGKWIYPNAGHADSDPWHAGDMQYTQKPSFKVKSKSRFFEKVFEDAKYDTEAVEENWQNVKSELDDAGFFDGSNYEAHIGGDYYGDEFEGWRMPESMQNKVADIIAKYHN